MNLKTLTLLALFALLSTNQAAAIIPSERAVETASQYLRTGEQASIVSRPYLVDGKQYFAVYLHPQNNPTVKNLVVVIDAESGELVESTPVLQKVYIFDSKLSFLQAFITEKKLSFAELKNAVQAAQVSRDQAEDTLNTVENNLIDVNENIAIVQTAFGQYTVNLQRLIDEIDNGEAGQELFEQEYSNQALDALVTRYNTTLKTLVETVKSGEGYQRAVINTSNRLTQKGIDQNKFKPGLQAAYQVGLNHFSTSTALESAFQEFNSAFSSESQRAINDSVQSYLYRKNKVETDTAIETIRGNAEEILRNKAQVEPCTPTRDLEKFWNDALNSQAKAQFNYVTGNVSLAEREIVKIRNNLSRCNETPEPQPTAKQNDWLNWAIAVVLLIVIGYFAIKLYKGKPKQIDEGPGEPKKANLFE